MKRLTLVAVLALAGAGTALAVPPAPPFAPNDPLAKQQWYLAQDHAFDYFPAEPPPLPPVRVAVIDSGIDGNHPEFEGRIVDQRSFVGGSAFVDTQGHGTFVAGEIAAATNNGIGIAGIAFPAELLVAKVVRADGTISIPAEAQAIRWAADRGARVINLSLGGLRDPLHPRRDTFSALEESAVEYAYRKGAVIVAAVGNGDQAPSTPWQYASYPAALPHVLGVAAIARDGSVPAFSNRDAVYVDLSAPGEDILSTFPRPLTARYPACVDQGYSDCGPPEYRTAEGTSFAAPQVAAAAALMLAVKPTLRPDQTTAILERTADDANATNGCRRCPLLRDRYTGWGRLDVAKALQALAGPPPPADRYEPNDEGGVDAYKLYGSTRTIDATLDFWDDQLDVYGVYVRLGQTLSATVSGPPDSNTSLVLWKPGTQRVEGLSLALERQRAAQSVKPGSNQSLAYRAPAAGWYYLEVKLGTSGAGPYQLVYRKT